MFAISQDGYIVNLDFARDIFRRGLEISVSSKKEEICLGEYPDEQEAKIALEELVQAIEQGKRIHRMRDDKEKNGRTVGLTFRLYESEARKIQKCASVMQIPVSEALAASIDLFAEKLAKDKHIHPTFLT